MASLKEYYEAYKSELETPKDRDSNVLIVDGLNTFIRVFSAVPALNDDGQHVGGVVGFLRSIGLNIRQFQSTRCIIIFDGKGGSQRRKKLYPEYKSGRVNKETFNRFDEFKDIVDEKESMAIQFRRLVEYLDILPITLISIDNIEADDVIAYITNQYYGNHDNKVTIVSSDKDFLQLVSDKVQVYSPVKKIIFTPENIPEHYNKIHPNNYLLYRTLTGDTSDNINGVKGVGLITLVNKIPILCEREITQKELFDYCEDQIEQKSKLKVYQTILDNKPIVDRNYKLMQLTETDISLSAKTKIISKVDEEITPLDKLQFKQLYIYDKLYAVIKDVDQWLKDTFNRLNTYAGRKVK